MGKNVPRMVSDSPEVYSIMYYINYLNFSIYPTIADSAVVTGMVSEPPYKQYPSPEGSLGSIPSHGASAF